MDTYVLDDIYGRLGEQPEKVVKKVMSLSKRDINEYSHAISESLLSQKKTSEGLFSFSANSTLSGDSSPCSRFECRMEKIQEMASFSALYADHVYVQNPFERLILFPKQTETEDFLLALTITRYLTPLLQAGLVSFTERRLPVCDHCLNKIYSINKTEIMEKSNFLNERLEKTFSNKCSASFSQEEDCSYCIELKGPEELINHGTSYLRVQDKRKLPKKWQKIFKENASYKLSKKEILELQLYKKSLQYVVRDITNLDVHSQYYGTKILSDNELQVRLAISASNDAKAANSEYFHDAIKHALPAVLDADLKEIIDLRKNETEAFNVYRDQLNNLISHAQKWDKKEIKDAFADTIRPEVNKITHTVKNWRKKKAFSLGKKALGTAIVAAGAYCGVLPPAYSGILAALGGITAAKGCISDIADLMKEPPVARENTQYFLWKITR